MKASLSNLLQEVSRCDFCAAQLALGPNPVLSLDPKSKIILVGQAPGLAVHRSRIPWSDASGKRLRQWLGVEDEHFYESKNFGILPMAFCYPGKGKSGDLPPSKHCAPRWHEPLLSQLEKVELVLLIGNYAQKYYLGKTRKKNLTETVMHFEDYLPKYFPIVHPSPLNYRWINKNPWFEESVVPALQKKVEQILAK